MPFPTPAEFLHAADARTIVAEARVGDLALFVGGQLVCTLPPGAAGASFSKAGRERGPAPTELHVYSNDGPGPTFTFSLTGLTWAEAERIADALYEAFDRASG